MSEPQAAFSKYFKAERDRSERTLLAIHEIVCGPGKTADEAIDAVMEQLERHWGRYGEPGSLEPLGNALADAGSQQQVTKPAICPYCGALPAEIHDPNCGARHLTPVR